MDNTEPSRFEHLWTVADVSEYLGVAVKTLYQWRCHGLGPRSYRVGGYLRYRPDEVRAWVDAQVVTT
ncbi:helix-turn-helix domain-containing protein [Mumia zhuanghuii]|uniref:Helix-turn-helix transcriptional regulator n=2 Tax=Mumia TaxID=1546255 RepID=A0ABW1QHU4_9ACTN|nr:MULTISPECIES: helix-turn-helix domain-containing protein [Mumia]KAA1418133.1 helix-turn-helix domain-containing protein [Mumia zhuanghuii]